MNNPGKDSRICSHRHAPWLDNLLRRLIQSPKKVIGPYLNPGDTAIDLGCGPGFFTIPMAEMAGNSGRVIGVDMQQEMLDKLSSKAAAHHEKSLAGRITAHQCTQHSLNLEPGLQADFILACYVVHETVDPEAFFRQVCSCLKPAGTLLVIEPPFHVTRKAFDQTIAAAKRGGLALVDRPKGKGGFSALFEIDPR